jgi:hypothetical protein
MRGVRCRALVCAAGLTTAGCVRLRENPAFDEVQESTSAGPSSDAQTSSPGTDAATSEPGPTTEADAGDSTLGGSSSSATTGAEAQCGIDDNETERTATRLESMVIPQPPIDTLDLEVGEGDTLDWFQFELTGSVAGAYIPWIIVEAFDPLPEDVDVCAYVRCADSPTQVWCPWQDVEDTSPAGYAGCCSGANLQVFTKYDCASGIHDALVYIAVRPVGDECFAYRLRREIIAGEPQ